MCLRVRRTAVEDRIRRQDEIKGELKKKRKEKLTEIQRAISRNKKKKNRINTDFSGSSFQLI